MLYKIYVIILLAGLSVAHGTDNLRQNVLNNLNIYLPQLKVNQINTTNIPNIYEVISGHKVFYVDSSGRYLFLGNLVDLKTKLSLTEDKVAHLSVVNWQQLPLDIALRQVRGNGKQQLIVFTDPDCPFCKQLERDTLARLTNITIYYFLFPLSIHANAIVDSKKILCAANPSNTYLQWMMNNITLPQNTTCINSKKLLIMQEVGDNIIGVDVTPTIILPNGKIITGAIPVNNLIRIMRDIYATPGTTDKIH